MTDAATQTLDMLRAHDGQAVFFEVEEPFDPPSRAGLRGPRQALEDPWREVTDAITAIEDGGLVATDERIVGWLDEAGSPISDKTLQNYRRKGLVPAARNRRSRR